MQEIIKRISALIVFVITFVIGAKNNDTLLCLASWLVSGVYVLAIISGGFRKIFKGDPITLFPKLSWLGNLTLTILCMATGILALIFLTCIEAIDYIQGIKED